MQLFFLYLAKVILTSGVMFCYYRLFLKDRTFHHYNRFYLLAVLVISLLLPLLKVDYFTVEVNSSTYLLLNKLQNINESKTLSHDHFYYQFTALGFGVAALFFLTRLLYGIFKIELLKRRYTREKIGDINFYQTALHEAPFSFFRNLFWKNSIPLHSDLGKQILKHEMVHIEQKHSWDKIFIEILTSIFWFNPFFYLIKKEISLIHEYLADKKAIKNSDTRAFAQMLLASQFSGNHLPATSPFLSSNLKKRLTMLKKSKTKYSYARRILALPLLFALAFIYMINAKNKEITKTNLEIEQMVAEIKKDTITPKDAAQGTDGTEIQKENPELFIDNDSLNEANLKKIQDQIAEKQKTIEPYKELMLKKNGEGLKISKEMRAKSEELQKLSMKKDFESPRFKDLEKEMKILDEKMSEIFDTEEFKNNQKVLELKFIELDQLYAKMDDYYNSDAFKLKIKDAEERAKEAEKQVNSPEFQLRIKEAEKAAKKKNAADIVFQNQNKEVNIYIDGKLVTKEEMNSLSPTRIERMNVYKKGYNGSKANEIHITTKK